MSVSVKKRLSLLLACVLVLGCLTACSTSAVSQESTSAETTVGTDTSTVAEQSAAVTDDMTWDDEPIEITFWYTYAADSVERTQFLDVVLPMWNELHPNVTINAVAQESGDTYHEATVAAIATGSTPDVARIDIVYTASYAELGALAALDSFSDFDTLKEKFLEAPLATNYYQGSYYGLPLDTNCKAAVINTDVMKAMGIEDGIPDTMEEFIAAAEPYVQSTGSSVLHVSGIGDWDFYPYFWLFGGVLTNDDYTQASGYLDSTASVSAIQTMLDLYNEGVFSIGEIDGTVDAWGEMANGTYAMYFEGPWYFGAYDENQDPVVVPALIPTNNGKSSSVVGGQDIVVFSTSEHQEAAYEFAKFMCSEEVQAAMLEAGVIPTVKTVAESEVVTSDPVLSIYMEQIKSAGARIPSPNHAAIYEIWKTAMNNIFLNGTDVQTELTSAATQIDAELAG